MKPKVTILATVLLASLLGVAQAQELGMLAGTYLGPMQYQVGNLVGNAPTTNTFTTANQGWCARIMARDTRDIKSIAVNFSAVTTPGTVTARIETLDANGEPTGTLYDANASKSFTPAVGWNVVTFDVLPTTGLAAGTMYGLVLIKDNAGTTCTLRSHANANLQGSWPICVLTAADATTRSNFSESANTTPVAYFVLEDDALAAMGCMPSTGGGTQQLTSADICVAQKIVLPVSVVIRGVRFVGNAGVSKVGTPTVDLRLRILNSSNSAVSGTTVTIDKDMLTQVNGRGLYVPLPPTTLAAGTYRIAFDSAGDGSNNFGMSYITLADAAFQGTGYCFSVSTDMSTTFTWSDTTTRMLPFGLELDSIPASSTNTIDPLTGTIPGL